MSRGAGRWAAGLALAAGIGIVTGGAVRAAAGGPVLLVTGNTNGVLEPCGCAGGQGGGLARRATLLARLRAADRDAVALDTGNLVSRLSPDADILDQGRRTLRALGFVAGALGPAELELGPAALAKLPAEGRLPLIASNVTGPAGERLGPASVVAGDLEVFAVLPGPAPAGFRLEEPAAALREPVARAAAAGRRVIVISHQAPAALRDLRAAVPGIALVLAAAPGSEGAAGEAVAGPGHGRELLRLRLPGPGGAAPAREVHAMPHELAQDPSVAVVLRAFYEARGRSFNRARPTPGGLPLPDLAAQAAEQCGTCHAEQQRQWAASKHAIAWHTLREKRADARPECVPCHTTSAAGTPTAKALGVGCAACHGDGAAHALRPTTPGLIRRRPTRAACEGCHTGDASPRFDHPKYLPAVRH